MFAWVLMDEKLFIITFFFLPWIHFRVCDGVVAGAIERKLITCVSYQVKLIINYTWWRGHFTYWFFHLKQNFNFILSLNLSRKRSRRHLAEVIDACFCDSCSIGVIMKSIEGFYSIIGSSIWLEESKVTVVMDEWFKTNDKKGLCVSWKYRK